jgi:hypothetical protein
VSAAALLTVPGFSANAERVTLVLIGVLVLVWLPTLRVPAFVIRPLAVVAAASLWIYLSHWQVYPLVVDVNGWLALAASVAAGIALAWAWLRMERGVTTLHRAWASGPVRSAALPPRNALPSTAQSSAPLSSNPEPIGGQSRA